MVKKRALGVFILMTDGTLVKYENYAASLNKDHVGIAIITEQSKFVVSPTVSGGISNSTGYNSNMQIGGMIYCPTDELANNDFDGKKNSANIKAWAESKGVIANAVQFCERYSFKNRPQGTWYQPSQGQLKLMADNVAEINKCINSIKGIPINKAEYLSSTQPRSGYFWWSDMREDLYSQGIYSYSEYAYVRPISDYEDN